MKNQPMTRIRDASRFELAETRVTYPAVSVAAIVLAQPE